MYATLQLTFSLTVTLLALYKIKAFFALTLLQYIYIYSWIHILIEDGQKLFHHIKGYSSIKLFLEFTLYLYIKIIAKIREKFKRLKFLWS